MCLFGKCTCRRKEPLDPYQEMARLRSQDQQEALKKAEERGLFIQAQALAEARKMALELAQNKQSVLATYIKDHEEDKASYAFKCMLWGNMLNISVSRNGHKRNLPNYGIDESYFNYTGAINMGVVSVVNLTEGHLPDEKGEVHYHTNDIGEVAQHNGYCRTNYCLPIIDENLRREYIPHNGYCYRTYLKEADLPNYPRPAYDDFIIFGGANLFLSTPAGLGKDIYNQIIQAKDNLL